MTWALNLLSCGLGALQAKRHLQPEEVSEMVMDSRSRGCDTPDACCERGDHSCEALIPMKSPHPSPHPQPLCCHCSSGSISSSAF